MKRLLALMAALALVAGAAGARALLDADDGGGGDGGGGGSGGGGGEAAGVVVCVPAVAEVCDALAADRDLEVRIEGDAETIDVLATPEGPGELTAWVAPAPSVAMTVEARQRAGQAPALGEPTAPVARSPLVLVGWDDRLAALEGTCGGEVTWRCLGEQADRPWAEAGGEPTWGAVKPGHDDPGSTAVGLLVLGQASASWFGTADFASNDFDDPAFLGWFDRLETTVADLAPPTGGTPLERMLSLGPSTYDAVGTTEAAGGPAVATSRDRERLRVLYPSPTTTVDVVVVGVEGADGEGGVRELFQSDEAATAFAEAGWRAPDTTPAPGVGTDPLPEDDGTPAPGVLAALRQLWQESIR